MANVAVLNMAGAQVGTIELNDAIFGIEANEHVMHLAVVQYLANQRQGTQSTKTRAEVRGGGRKPYRQKGTGRARQGSIRSPQWVGGGVVFAPKPRDYSFKLNKKVKRLALQSALSTKVAEGKIIVLDELTLSEVKTKEMVKVLGNIKCDNALIVMDGSNENVMLSARNIPTVTDIEGDLVTSIVNGKDCVFTCYQDLKDLGDGHTIPNCCLCTLERAYREGKSKFKKPISCALYPIRAKDFGNEVYGINYNKWRICKDAIKKGEELNLPVYKFLEGPLIEKFGKEWYDELCEVAEQLLADLED